MNKYNDNLRKFIISNKLYYYYYDSKYFKGIHLMIFRSIGNNFIKIYPSFSQLLYKPNFRWNYQLHQGDNKNSTYVFKQLPINISKYLQPLVDGTFTNNSMFSEVNINWLTKFWCHNGKKLLIIIDSFSCFRTFRTVWRPLIFSLEKLIIWTDGGIPIHPPAHGKFHDFLFFFKSFPNIHILNMNNTNVS